MKGYIEHLKAQVMYWQMISAAEKEKKIYNLEDDK